MPFHVIVRAADVVLVARQREDAAIAGALKGVVSTIEASDGPFAAVLIALEGGEILTARSTRFAIERLNLVPGSPVSALIGLARWAKPVSDSPSDHQSDCPPG